MKKKELAEQFSQKDLIIVMYMLWKVHSAALSIKIYTLLLNILKNWVKNSVRQF